MVSSGKGRVGAASGWLRCALRSACRRSAPKRGRPYRRIRRCTPFARGQSCGAPAAPTLTHWTGVITTPEACGARHSMSRGNSRTDATLRRCRTRSLCGRGGATARCPSLFMVCRFPIWQVTQRQGRIVVEVTACGSSGRNSGRSNDPQQPGRVAGVRANAAGFTFVVVFDSVRTCDFPRLQKDRSDRQRKFWCGLIVGGENDDLTFLASAFA